MSMSRRRFLALMGGSVGAAVAGSAGLTGCSGLGLFDGSTGRVLPSEAELPARFRVPLPIPPVRKPVRSDAGVDYYEITQRRAEAEILPGKTTEIWAYDGIFPGPTIESRSGRKTVVRHRNDLPVPAAVHLHGGRTPPDSDGYPTDLILPADGSWRPRHADEPGWSFHDGAKEYAFPLEQRATTLWYHDHRMDFTGPQVWRGLAGFHLIHDDEEDALPLPGGDRDIPLMICDRSFGRDGELLYPSRDPSLRHQHGVTADYSDGVLGDVILVNGAPWPVLEVSNTRYRFRILNASNARRYELALDPEPEGGASFTQVGSDGGLLGAPVTHRRVPIAQAERFDVVIDFSKYPVDSVVTLRNTLEDADSGTGQIMRFRVVRKASDDSAVPSRLADMREFDSLVEAEAETTREFRFRQGGQRDGMPVWVINGNMFDPTRMDARPRLGATEIWDVRADVEHPIHLHLVHFKVLSRDGEEPRPTDAGWKDVVDLTSGGRARLLVRFDGYRGRYVFHCHNLEHEDMMMMANFKTL